MKQLTKRWLLKKYVWNNISLNAKSKNSIKSRKQWYIFSEAQKDLTGQRNYLVQYLHEFISEMSAMNQIKLSSRRNTTWTQDIVILLQLYTWIYQMK